MCGIVGYTGHRQATPIIGPTFAEQQRAQDISGLASYNTPGVTSALFKLVTNPRVRGC